MSSHDTRITGRLSRPQPLSPGRYLQPPADAQASHSANVTSNLPTANGLAIVTLRWGPSLSNRPFSSVRDPIKKFPEGTTTISGQSGQSVKLSFGMRHLR